MERHARRKQRRRIAACQAKHNGAQLARAGSVNAAKAGALKGRPLTVVEAKDPASCIDACSACATECDHCAAACLRQNDVKMLARCIQLDLDCAEICRIAAAYMGRGSELTADICEACAEVCDVCAEECEKHDKTAHCLRPGLPAL